LGIHAVHGVDLEQGGVLLVVARPADLALQHVALAQRHLPHLRERDIDVLGSRRVPGGPQEAVAVRKQVEDARDRGRVRDLLGPLLLLADAALLALPAALLARRTLATSVAIPPAVAVLVLIAVAVLTAVLVLIAV